MVYDRLRSRIESDLDCRDVVALPDGSVDRYYAVRDAVGGRIRTRSDFVDRMATGDARSFRLAPQAVSPGGQAVNAATQVDALGHAVRLYGHLDDPELGPFPFRTVSMGAPATVHVLSFDEEALMLSVESGDIRDWTVETLFAAAGIAPDDWISDEVVVIQNWVGFPGMSDALAELAEVDLGGGTVVFDPGDVSGAPAEPLRSLCGALERLGETTDVVLTANDRELARLADVPGVECGAEDEGENGRRESDLRDELGVEAVVRHAETRALVAAEDLTVVDNFEARQVVRRTGAGDRFDGGLAVGLAADLPWDEVLALGNACATHFVESGETATEADVVDVLERRTAGG